MLASGLGDRAGGRPSVGVEEGSAGGVGIALAVGVGAMVGAALGAGGGLEVGAGVEAQATASTSAADMTVSLPNMLASLHAQAVTS